MGPWSKRGYGLLKRQRTTNDEGDVIKFECLGVIHGRIAIHHQSGAS